MNLRHIKMTDWIGPVGNFAIIWTIGLFLCGSQICHKIIKEKSVGEISSIPFLAAFINCVLNFQYGILIENNQIMLVNTVGFNLEAIYIFIFLYYANNKKKLFHQILFVMFIAASVGSYAFMIESDQKRGSKTVGTLASLAAIIMFGSPLVTIRNVIKTQSTESLSFPLCLANFGCSGLWGIYGVLINDYFVIIPNLLGSILGFAQVSLFAKFPSQSVATRMKYKSDDPIN